MLNKLIQFSLHNRLFVVAFAALIMVYGVVTIINLPVDVLPDLNRPRVTIFLESNGLAPEEIETQVILPVETSLNGAPGVEVVRSSAAIGIGMVFVEFDWKTDVYRARQLVAEKLQTVQLPNGITPVMGPISSVMGQIMLIGVSSDTTSPADLRTLADFTIRRRLMSIKGVSQVIPIGGERKQYQILISSDKLRQYNLSVDDIDNALLLTNQNTTGNFFNRFGSEVLIRNVGRANTLADLAQTVVGNKDGLPVILSQVADVKFGSALKRGDASINAKPAVILTVEKQPGANTVQLTDEVEKALLELQTTLPKDVKLNSKIFQQKNFIVNSLKNVEEALRDGFILVVIILFLFLLNFRTTIITLTAIPLSLVISAIIFKAFDISINTLTLGGLAIAIGELVDDAIVDVENVFRRLKENSLSPTPQPILQVIYHASSEVRNSIVYATIIVVLVFLPLFYMQGIEGKIFAPLGIAYITSIVASLVVSLTLTPALCSYLLNNVKTHEEKDSILVRFLKRQDTKLLHWGLARPKFIIGVAVLLIVAAAGIVPFFGTEFLPPFNEGSFTINFSTPAGTSLEESNRIGTMGEKLMLRVPEVEYVSRRTGRAELDEHVEPVSNSEIEVELKDNNKRTRDEILADIRKELTILKGVSVNVGQPISHRLDHLLSGVRSQVAIKLFGPDLNDLRLNAGKIKQVVSSVQGAVDVQIEKQVLVPQLLIKVNREALQRYGIQAGKVSEILETFYNGKVEGQILDGQKTFDILLRTTDEERSNIEKIRNTQVSTANGNTIPLYQIANIEATNAINSIYHENTQRRIVISCNVQGRDLGSTVKEIQAKIGKEVKLPSGFYVQYGGQFESQQEASKLIGLLSIFALAGIFLVLYSHFKSSRIVLQIMLNVPLALIGSVIAVILTGGTFSIATLVGFITLTGIASRNGIMMISHYIHLIEQEGETFSAHMIIRGSLERLVPVLMTALVAALALIPLTLDAQASGKEILYPVATVILGGLISSTLLDMIVTPVVFYQFGEKALETYFKNKKQQEF
ncbi:MULTISPECIES: efflux RND transporter permease subunit [unclassified Arcicella]|uniref:efflux RND transporter permease subunit n=1 Tax=unclassified Arcicella TaxID=2644986 RepID=UPI00285C9A28|nr:MULTISPECIES: efflux RND transporter permease subunit [unclassified Arcicella]MDR6563733.1 HME family heavy-metal exporter [Arcicella sp. BE51]MDR6813583.1 HME family heavy-metal exporter [Arcicella sp. BE140]MDR6824895.1 HME family heavy-metal exporter [Arcicella sp. BE139]